MSSRGLKPFVRGALWVSYPFILCGGLYWGSPRLVGGLLLVSLVLRQRSQARQLFSGFGWIERGVVLLLMAHALLSALTNSELLVRLFPCAMNLGMFTLFTYSLRGGQTMIERFARLQEPDLPPEGVQYTRRVTQVWCVFLGLNTLVSVWTVFGASRDVWAVYNGFIVYLLMGVLFVGEWLYRQRVQRKNKAIRP